MTVASEITRLQNAKADIKTAIEAKGVTVPSDLTIDGYACCIDAISGGDGLLPITQPTINGIAEHGKNCICWDDPDDDSCRGTQLTCWTGTTLVRKEGSDPTSIDDGVAVVTNTTRDQYASTYYSDGGLTNGCTYHYRAFANVSVGEPSCSSVICLTPTKGFDVDFLLVGGGGGGGGSCWYRAAGGGGAGGLIQCSKYQIGNIDTANVTVGAGGTYGYRGYGGQGCNSSFTSSLFTFTAYGGGAGAGAEGSGCSGGSGGGASGSYYTCYGGSGTTGQGYGGGSGGEQNAGSGGGSGGAGGSGYNYGNNPGGAGTQSSISGTATWYAGGGGGGASGSYSSCGSTAGGNGGGNGGGRCGSGSGATTYGSGGGGSGGCGNYGGSGCQGIFIMRYNKNCGYDISGGCKYECGDYCIHCFTSSGTLTFN